MRQDFYGSANFSDKSELLDAFGSADFPIHQIGVFI